MDESLPVHRGFHGLEYREAVILELRRLDSFKKAGASDNALLKRVEKIELSLASRLESGELWLNNADAALRNLGPFKK